MSDASQQRPDRPTSHIAVVRASVRRKRRHALVIALCIGLLGSACGEPYEPLRTSVTMERQPLDGRSLDVISSPITKLERRGDGAGERPQTGYVILDKAYRVVVLADTRIEDADRKRLSFTDLARGQLIEMVPRPMTFTTSTYGVPKWVVVADRIVVVDRTAKRYPYQRFTIASGVLQEVQERSLMLQTSDRELTVQVDAETVFEDREGRRVPRASVAPGSRANVVYGLKGIPYIEYLSIIRDTEMPDYPPGYDPRANTTAFKVLLH